MLKAGRRWTLQLSITVSQDVIVETEPQLQRDLRTLIEDLGRAGRPIFILLDEVQRFFATRYIEGVDEFDAPQVFFKLLVSPSPGRAAAASQVYFAMTGSSMCQAWLGFAKAPPNNHTLVEARELLTIPVNEDKTVHQVTKQHLRR